MLAHDRRIFEIPLEERLKRTFDLVAWTKAMFPAIHQSLHDAQEQVNTGHQDIREYFSVNATPAEQKTTTATNATVEPSTNNAGARNELLALRERLHHARALDAFRCDDSNGNQLDSNQQSTSATSPRNTQANSASQNSACNDQRCHGSTDQQQQLRPTPSTCNPPEISASKKPVCDSFIWHSTFLPWAQQ
jgi:hypothetical protein